MVSETEQCRFFGYQKLETEKLLRELCILSKNLTIPEKGIQQHAEISYFQGFGVSFAKCAVTNSGADNTLDMSKRSSRFVWAVVLICWANIVNGSVILEYRGNNFDSVSSSGPTTPTDLYTTSDRITGWIELAAPLASNLVVGFVSPLSFSFGDGVNTITDTTATQSVFAFSTDAAGEVIGWDVGLNSSVFGPGEFVRSIDTTTGLGVTSNDVFDTGQELLCGPGSISGIDCDVSGTPPAYNQFANVENSPGTWEYRVPVSSPLVLLGLGLLVFGHQKHRQSKTAQDFFVNG